MILGISSSVLVPTLGSGFVQGCVLALVAAGFTVIYRATKLVNFANGQQLVFGGYVGWYLASHTSLPFWVTAILVVLAGFGLGVVIERLVLGPVRNAPLLSQVIVLLALAQILDAAYLDIFGAEPRDSPSYAGQTSIVPKLNWSATDLVIIGVSIAALAALGLLLYRTDIGARMRANADNRMGAGLVGINPHRVALLAWGIGGALAALSGAVLAPKFLLSSAVGSTFTFNAFAAVTIGSVGSVSGAIAGGLFVGLAEALIAAEFNAGYEPLVSLAIMFIVLTIRPTGLLAREA